MLTAERMLLAGLAAAVISSPSVAAPLPNGSDPSADLVYNFDYTSLMPPGGFLVEAIYEVVFDPINSSGSVVIDLFGDLNGGNFLTSDTVSPSTIVFLGLSQDLAIFDGLFSVGLRGTPGSNIIAGTPESSGFVETCDLVGSPPPGCTIVGQTPFITGVLAPGAAIPEPATLGLIGIAFAAVGLRHRRRNGDAVTS